MNSNQHAIAKGEVEMKLIIPGSAIDDGQRNSLHTANAENSYTCAYAEGRTVDIATCPDSKHKIGGGKPQKSQRSGEIAV